MNNIAVNSDAPRKKNKKEKFWEFLKNVPNKVWRLGLSVSQQYADSTLRSTDMDKAVRGSVHAHTYENRMPFCLEINTEWCFLKHQFSPIFYGLSWCFLLFPYLRTMQKFMVPNKTEKMYEMT